MSKGSKRRPTAEAFKNNYDNIKWGSVQWKPVKKKAPARHHHIMPDIEPYTTVGGDNPGEVISSRSKEREYLKRNNCIQVGNEKDYFFKHDGKDENNPTRGWGQ